MLKTVLVEQVFYLLKEAFIILAKVRVADLQRRNIRRITILYAVVLLQRRLVFIS